jgi:hypothetical protein
MENELMSDDQEAREQRIRERAYALWEAGGRQEGSHEEHWHQARQELGDTTHTGSLDDQLADTFPASDPLSITDPDSGTRALPAAPEDEPPEAPVKKSRAAPKKKPEAPPAEAAGAPQKPRGARKKPVG